MRYVNPYQKESRRGLIHALLWACGYYKERERPPPLPKAFSYPNSEEKSDPAKPRITWINHSTFWIQAFGKSLLVDPIWNKRCSPLSFLGPKRQHPPRPPLEAISQLDAVIISHNHYDHLDRMSVERLLKRHPRTLWVVPTGVKKWFTKRYTSAQVIELAWWEKYKAGDLTFTAVPAQHFSGRGIFDRDQTLWMGCVIEFNQTKRLYFVGDTGYNEFDFKEIRSRFPQIDLSLIPIGAYSPRGFMKPVHVDPKEAVQIHLDVGSQLSVAGHWGTFHLSSEERERPPFELYTALEVAGISPETFRVLYPGQTVNW